MSGTASWLVPALVYVGLMGGIGIVTKFALHHMGWQDLIVWTALVYAVVAVCLVALGQASLSIGAGTFAAIGAGLCASLALVALYVALGGGEASKVVPVSSIYPVVTMILAAIFLAEGITPVKLVAVILVTSGVVLLSATG